MIFGNWLWPSRRRQLFSAASANLKIMASAVLFERHPLERTVRWRTVANELSTTFVVRNREVVEGEQRVAILDQTLDRLVVFDAPGLDEGVEGRKRILLGFGHPDFLQRPLGFQLLALRQFVEDVGGFMHPAALAARVRPYLFERLPESKRAISDRELGANREPAPLQIEEQFPPRLRTLAHTVGEADKLLPALGCGSDDDQQALRAVFETGLHMNAVNPEVDVAFGREITLAPA